MRFSEELGKCRSKHKMITVYGDEYDHDYYFTGYIQAVDDSGLLMSKQNYGGYNSGFVFFKDIIYFEGDTFDTKRHEKLFQLRKIKPDTLEINGNDCLFENTLKVCLERQFCVDIFKKENDEGDILGFVSEICSEYILAKRISKYGEYIGKTYIEKSDIFRIFIEGDFEQSCRLLYDDLYKSPSQSSV